MFYKNSIFDKLLLLENNLNIKHFVNHNIFESTYISSKLLGVVPIK